MPDTEKFKNLLEQEKERVEGELQNVGRINPENPADWEPTPGEWDVMRADKNEVADTYEEYEERSAVEVELENYLQDIRAALKRIEDGTYGTCKVGGEAIPEDRLEAYPAAKTCVEHAEEA